MGTMENGNINQGNYRNYGIIINLMESREISGNYGSHGNYWNYWNQGNQKNFYKNFDESSETAIRTMGTIDSLPFPRGSKSGSQ